MALTECAISALRHLFFMMRNYFIMYIQSLTWISINIFIAQCQCSLTGCNRMSTDKSTETNPPPLVRILQWHIIHVTSRTNWSHQIKQHVCVMNKVCVWNLRPNRIFRVWLLLLWFDLNNYNVQWLYSTKCLLGCNTELVASNVSLRI